MSKYSSLLFAPEKYHEIGPFRFPIYEDLVPGEAKRVEEISRKQAKATFTSVKLAKRIAQDKQISTTEALDLISTPTGSTTELLLDYTDDLEELQRNANGVVEQQIEFVTLFMRHRGEAKLPDKKGWQKLTDWTAEDTEEMPTKLMEQVFQVMLWERDGWPQSADSGNEQPPTSIPETP